MADEELIERARRLADDVLFPAALATDRADVLPVSLLDRLAEAGLYGLTAPEAVGGRGADRETVCAVYELLAGACLTTTFVLAQHLMAVANVAEGEAVPRERWASPMARGDVRAGVAFAHLRRPGPPVLTATATKGGWRIDGAAPWVTGWGRIDIVFVGARVGDDLAWLLVDATASPSMRIHLLDLAAVRASATVVVDFDGHVVGADRLVRLERFDDWKERDRRNARPNASLALGLTARACALLGPSPLDDELVDVRAVLDAAGPDEMPVARAASTELAVRATAALVVACGGRSIVTDHHAQRLAREALFLLVQAQTPAIRAEQLRILTGRVGDLRRG